MKRVPKGTYKNEPLSILIVDDEQAICDGLKQFLLPEGFRIVVSNKSPEALNLIKRTPFDIVILDLMMPEIDGISFLKELRVVSSETEVIMISGYGEVDNVVEAMKLGAVDFFQKPFKLQDIRRAIENTVRYHDLKTKFQEVNVKYQHLSDELNTRYGKKIIGHSSGMKEIMDLMTKVAAANTTSVLVTGESGTGKELIARGIHLMSKRRDNLFLPINCSSISDSLFESEFFGHTKGSFTGAFENRQGYFEAANNGTLFLDEIGDLRLDHQAKLLRALEDRKISKVGSFKEIGFNVRIIAATNQNIDHLLAVKKFRSDLYHRINSFIIHVPPLRDRKEDIPLLLKFFIEDLSKKLNKKVSGFDRRLPELLFNYDFPGNIRELRNMVERAIILCNGNTLTANHFPVLKNYPEKKAKQPIESCSTYDLGVNEKEIIMAALNASGKNRNKAAQMLNISWQSLDRRLKKFGIEV